VSTEPFKPPSQRVGELNKNVADLFQALREATLTSGPLDRSTCEMIVVAGFAALNCETSFKTHSRRLVKMNVPKATLQHAVLATLGATTVIYQVANALEWIDDVYNEGAVAA